MSITRITFASLSAGAASALLLLATSAAAQTRYYSGFTLIDGSLRQPVAGAAMVVRDGRIVAAGPAAAVSAPADAQRVSLDGRFVIPGLINAHGHVNAPDDLRVYAAYGTTTVFSLGDVPDAVFASRAQQDTPALDRARVFIASPALAPMTHDTAVFLANMARAKKPDLFKIRVDDNLGTTRKSPREAYGVVIDIAHRLGLQASAHLFYLGDARALLDADIDIIAHSIRDSLVDAAIVARIIDKRVCYIPTLMREVSTFVYEQTPAFFGDSLFLAHANREWMESLSRPDRQLEFRRSASAQRYKAALDVAKTNLRKLSDAGARVAMGTDTGPMGRFQGYFELMELELMRDAGMGSRQILAAATREAARCMRVDRDLGTLEPGKWADFIVLDADPIANISNVRRISSVYIAGNKVPR